MIGMTLSDLIGGEPMPETPVFYVRTPRERNKVLEKIAADDAAAALTKAKELVGDVEGLFVTGPHEHVPVEQEAFKSKPNASAQSRTKE